MSSKKSQPPPNMKKDLDPRGTKQDTDNQLNPKAKIHRPSPKNSPKASPKVNPKPGAGTKPGTQPKGEGTQEGNGGGKDAKGATDSGKGKGAQAGAKNPPKGAKGGGNGEGKPTGKGAGGKGGSDKKGGGQDDEPEQTPGRVVLKSTLPVWLWIWHVEKRRMNLISRGSSVNYTVRVQEEERVLVDVYPVGPQASTTTLPEAAKAVSTILTNGKKDYPIAIDVTGFELEAEEHVASNQTGCFVCQSPEDITVLVGPFKDALAVYALINPDADIDALAKKLGRRVGYKEKPPPPPPTPSPPPPPPPPPPKKPRVFTDGPVTILPTKNTKEGVLADKYLWMFLKHAFSDRIKRIISPYKTKEFTDDEYTVINLIPNNSGTTRVQKSLFDFVHEYEKKCAHHVITVKDPVHQKQVDEVARNSELSLICREDAIVHIVTLGEKMDEEKQKIYDILAGKYGQEPEPEPEDAKGKDKYVRKLNFKYGDQSNISIFEGNITNLRVDAIVNPANSALHNSDGISKAISRAAGPDMDQECKMRVANRGRLVVTKNYVSRSYHLPCKAVIHMVGPMWKSYDDKEKCEKHLYQTFSNCLKEAAKQKYKALGLPVDSSVLWGVPLDMVTKHLCAAVTDHYKQNKKSTISHINIVDLNKAALGKLQSEFLGKVDESLVQIS